MTDDQNTVDPNTVELDPRKQYILVGDISLSMRTKDCPGGTSRYDYMVETFADFIRQAEQFDPDGPTVILYGQEVHVYEDTKLVDVQPRLSNPTFERMTMTGAALKKAHELHMRKKAADPDTKTVTFIFTDGTWHDDLEGELVRCSQANQTDDEFSASVLTVGEVEGRLQAELNRLDNELVDRPDVPFDIFDTDRLENTTFISAVDGAIND